MNNYGYGGQGYSGYYRPDSGGYSGSFRGNGSYGAGGGNFRGNGGTGGYDRTGGGNFRSNSEGYDGAGGGYNGAGSGGGNIRENRGGNYNLNYGGGFRNSGGGFGNNTMYGGSSYGSDFADDRGGISRFGGGGGYNFNETMGSGGSNFNSNSFTGGEDNDGNTNNPVMGGKIFKSKFQKGRNKQKESGLKSGGKSGKNKNKAKNDQGCSDTSNKTLEECLKEGSVIKNGRTHGAKQIKYRCLHCKIDFVKDKHILKGGHRGHVKNCHDLKACFEGKVEKEETDEDKTEETKDDTEEDNTEETKDDNEDNTEETKDGNEENRKKLNDEFEELSNDGWILSPCEAFKFYSCLHCGEKIRTEKLFIHLGGKHHRYHLRHCVSDEKCRKKGKKKIARKDRRFKKLCKDTE